MHDTTRVDFHCHSNHSDGFHPPRDLAGRLASARVRYAALTDHDTTAGLVAFEEALSREGINCIPGVEITVGSDDDRLHLLAYGFDPEDEALQARLKQRRDSRSGRNGADAIPSHGRRPAPGGPAATEPGESAAWLEDLIKVVAMVHQAHGRAFLAHPLSLTQDPDTLDRFLGLVRGAGVDGLEALYASYSELERFTLTDLARKHGFLISAGSDYHGPQHVGPPRPGMDMPTAQWKAFRDAVIASPRPTRDRPAEPPERMPLREPPMKDFILRVLVPALLAIGLFVSSMFAVFIPASERQLLDRKKEMIRELTNSAWSILAEYERQERSGKLTSEEAQTAARARIAAMRYGPEGKDYFWITDMTPRMIMHPYREDLVGQDLSDFEDPGGVKLFVEFADLVRRDAEGYLEYIWQWKDDPQRLAPKESYVRGFGPWGWIIGTGLYIEDVEEEIRQLTSQVIDVSVVITVFIVLLLFFITHQSLRIERRRRDAVEELDESLAKYRVLVEAGTDGTIMVIEGKCTYSNGTAQDLLGYTAEEFSLLDVFDLFPANDGDEEEGSDRVRALLEGEETPEQFTAQLKGRDGMSHDVVLSATPMSFAGKKGIILGLKDISLHKRVEEALGESREKYDVLTENLSIGVLRTGVRGGGVFIELNPAAMKIFGFSGKEDFQGRHLVEFFDEAEVGRAFLGSLRDEGTAPRRIVRLRREDGDVSIVTLSAALSSGDQAGEYADIIVDDITERTRAQEDRENLIIELQTSMLFLNEPIRYIMGELSACRMGDSVEKVAGAMQREGCSAMAVMSEGEELVGIVTNHDFRERVLRVRGDIGRPVFEIMSAPVVGIEQDALVYEAILRMQEHAIRYLVVRSDGGAPVSILQDRDLIRIDRYSVSVLTREIQEAVSVQEIASTQARLPVLVKGLLDSGARSRSVTRIITTVADTIIERLVALAVERLGPPPARFAFVALGSEGRGEQTLKTDQDNALIFEDPKEEDKEAWTAWFQAFSVLVCDWFDEAGYALCGGDLMAKNPDWCQPLSVWKGYFRKWVATADPQEMLEINKFFDFRLAYGDQGLLDDLRASLRESFRSQAPFFYHFAETALLAKPPLGLFGKIVVESGEDRSRTFSIKDPMMLIVGFARLYALRHDLVEANTVDRLNRLYDLNVLTSAMHRETVQGFDYLMRMRLAHQARAISEGRPPDNRIDRNRLTELEVSMLKQIFSQITGMQNKIRNDFGPKI